MKKFLIFLVAIITTVCIGVTFYQFAKNDEVIKVNAQTVYINYGDKLSLDDLGFSRKEASKETSINFNAGGDEVTSIIKYDELTGCYIPTSKGGSTTIKITTTNRKYKSFSIDVKVGIGTEEFPYYITNEAQLFDVTNKYIDQNACFEVVNDIALTQPHNPIGLVDDVYREFTGKFNGKYHTISNLNIESCDYAGLFAILSANSQVFNLNIDNARIEGSFINAGAVAGICYGNINKVAVSNATITNEKEASNTGAVVGLLQTDALNNITAGILRTTAYTDLDNVITAKGNLGGIAGSVDSAIIHACHTKLNLKSTTATNVGGLVGVLTVNPDTYIRESYSISNIDANGNVGNIAGLIALDNDIEIKNVAKELVLVGLYYDKTLNSFSGVGVDSVGFASATGFAINGKSTAEMLVKNTYIYYVNSASDIVYWDKVWYLVNGEYPTLTFVNKFDEVVLDKDETPTTPEDPSNPDISNPDTPSVNAVIITNKQELLNAFQKSNVANGNYILNADIDLEGYNWIPVNFTGTFKSSENHNYTISNFTIVGNDLLYAGFFYNLTTATISNITFSNVQLTSTTNMETVGVVVGHIRGNVIINNIDVVNATINVTSKYTGGIAGYINNYVTKIEKCQVQGLTVNGSSANAGGIVGYVSSDAYIISCKVKNSNTLKGIDRIGGIASVNHGTIYDCSFNGNIQSISNSNAGYFGGLVGINYAKVVNSNAYAEINVNNQNNDIQYFVGGLCGYNMGEFTKCGAYADEFSASESTGIVYLAGLTAYNSGNLTYCVAEVGTIGSVNNNIYSAGLAVFNYGGNIFGCFAFTNLNGYQVAGLVRTNTNNGTVDSCMAGLNYTDTYYTDLGEYAYESFARANYKGVKIASFAYEVSSGTISNCVVNANLNCTNEDGWVAGFVGFMPLTNKQYGTISNSIANVSFSGVGDKYLDMAGEGLMKKKRTTGTITNCIISEDADVAGVIVSEYSKFLWITYDAGSQSNYIVASSEQMSKIDTYLDPNNCNFNISAGISDSKWVYAYNSGLVIPRAYLDVFGYDIIGL